MSGESEVSLRSGTVRGHGSTSDGVYVLIFGDEDPIFIEEKDEVLVIVKKNGSRWISPLTMFMLPLVASVLLLIVLGLVLLNV